MAVFCASSILATPFLEVDTSNTETESWRVLEEGDANPEADVSEHKKSLGKLKYASSWSGVRLQMLLIGAIFFVSVATLWVLTSLWETGDSSSSNVERPADFDHTEEGWTSWPTEARTLMMNYIQLKLANDMVGFKKMIEPTTTLTIDLSEANWIVRAAAKQVLPKDHMVGWNDIGLLYANFPSVPGDTPPVGDDILCTTDTCRTTFLAHREALFYKVVMKMDSVFKFNLRDRKIESIILKPHL